MTSFALTPRVAGLILAVCLITTFPSHAFAQGPNPLIGVWTLNLAKSTYSPERMNQGSDPYNYAGRG